VSMVKPMALFHCLVASGAIQQAVARVQQPYRDKHRCWDHHWNGDASGFRYEPCPDCRYGRSIERKKMPQGEPVVLLHLPVGLPDGRFHALKGWGHIFHLKLGTSRRRRRFGCKVAG